MIKNYKNVGIFTHSDCILHLIPNHPEKPQRIEIILNKLKQHFSSSIFFSSSLISDENILLFHSSDLLNNFKNICLNSKKNNKILSIDSDTNICPKTENAVYRSAGSIIDVINRLYLNKNNPERLRF